jgi:hypothetical protein
MRPANGCFWGVTQVGAAASPQGGFEPGADPVKLYVLQPQHSHLSPPPCGRAAKRRRNRTFVPAAANET